MHITVNTTTEAKHDGFADSVADRVTRTLSRFSNRISRVMVTLTDENGPRGGVDKQCRVSVVMPRFGELAVSAKDENPWAAVAQAALRIRRKIVTKLKRPQSLRARQRTSQIRSSDSVIRAASEIQVSGDTQ